VSAKEEFPFHSTAMTSIFHPDRHGMQPIL
jgi:hypothetical protein